MANKVEVLGCLGSPFASSCFLCDKQRGLIQAKLKYACPIFLATPIFAADGQQARATCKALLWLFEEAGTKFRCLLVQRPCLHHELNIAPCLNSINSGDLAWTP